tara:strand:- start:6622 stop:7695 length:1074 start_codon:yes stop_codon:yes gene_type:complete
MTQTRDLILHIGHYKTGTTALQVFLHQNRALLALQGLHYASAPVKNAKHSALAYALLREAGVDTLLHGFNNPATAADLWDGVIQAARALPAGQALLISSEEFMRLGAHPVATTLLADILATAPDLRLRVIAYLRPPQDHLQSWYNQLVKMGVPVGPFDTAVRCQMEPIHWDYGAALAPWIALAGADNVILRGFHPALRRDDALFADFLEALGARLPVTADSPLSDPNPRLDDRLLPLKRAYDQAALPQKLTAHLLLRAQALLGQDRNPAELDGAPDFDTLRETARAGITALAALPQARLDAGALLAHLPQATPPEARALSDAVSVLAGELAQLRMSQRKILARLDALEALTSPDADG